MVVDTTQNNTSNITTNTKQLTIFPFSCGWIDDAEQLVVRDCLGVEINRYWPLLHVLIGLEQRLPDHTFTSSSVTKTEDRMTDDKQLLQLYHLVHRTKGHDSLLDKRVFVVKEHSYEVGER